MCIYCFYTGLKQSENKNRLKLAGEKMQWLWVRFVEERQRENDFAPQGLTAVRPCGKNKRV